jgi:DinB superfamily
MPDRRDELQVEVSAAHGELLRMVDSLTPDEWKRMTYEGWTSKDTFSHLATIQERQRAQVQCALDGTPWNPEDVNVYNGRKVEERKDWSTDQVRDEFGKEQAATLALLRELKEEDLQRTFKHPTRGEVTVESVFVQVATHTRNHARDIKASRIAGTTPSTA